MNPEELALSERVKHLEEKLENFVPVEVMLRLGDGKVHPVILFAQVEKPQKPTFSIVE